MRVPVEWLRSLVELPDAVTTEQLADRLTMYDLKLEEIVGGGLSGPLTVGRVLAISPEEQKNGKTINWCRVDVGAHNEPSVPDAPGDDVPSRGIICGAHNFGVGDLVVVSLPGTYLPALGFEIGSRKTYGHVSDGMICSTTELGLAEDESTAHGIVVLEPGSAEPGDDAIALLGLADQTLDLEVNPDRAYALSLRGVARDAALAFDVPFTDPADRPVPSTDTAAYPVRVEDPIGCPVFTTLVVEGIDPSAKTPAWLAKRITDAGMRPISLTVDVSNYVMLELGQPNHCYDRAKLSGDIVVRRAHEGETLRTLDDVDRKLSTDDLLITDAAGPIGLAGVMGGDRVEIDATSTDVVIEAAHFDPVTIFRTQKRHKLPTEAAKRFERGVDPELPLRAATRVAELLVELAGGTLAPGATVVGTAPERKPVTFSTELPARISGLPITTEQARDTYERNGCLVEVAGDRFTVTPPSWRFDLNDPYDFVEEALRTAGYENVPSVLPTPTGGRGLTRSQELRRRVGHVLAGAGLVEVTTLPFVGDADLDRLALPQGDPRRDLVRLANPLSAEEPGLTPTLLIGLLRAASLNIGRGHDSVQISEIGRVFHPRSGDAVAPIYGVDRRPTAEELAALDAALPEQPRHVGFVLVGERERSGWSGPGRPVAWTDALEIARLLAQNLHVELTVEAAQLAPFHPGRCAQLSVGEQVVGHVGELHPKVAEAYGLPGRVAVGELDLDALIDAAPLVGPKPDFSAFPVAKEDFAFIVDEALPAGELESVIAGASDLLESVRLFDVYTGDQVGEGSKSLAFKVRLRADDRTLTEADIKAARDQIVAAAATLGAQLR
ncbi:phenylalanine--tRNA ligase subunit beta [Aeromicrobium sp. 636]|uniref:Phenylalanine--tRNA ligase beta subunit n=1 Tax=Aeromicrobium senzhongii TaxID=2663859 RepID=A0A8I0ETD4_9ACTN|nr:MULTISPECIES: phenylalanine--tRNA ligase subunit beta [Aeromicrobium]MBC9225199.1 phenylalanine--tRNA ligase subunit beta [Aeromicrobium senzhongii]MCQ3997309.1 phenylalanine--tRNA ligase subunit beta [Aeromicrobium sp. 636]